jgi:hypothetical protein
MKKEDVIKPVKSKGISKSYSKFRTPQSSKGKGYEQMNNEVVIIPRFNDNIHSVTKRHFSNVGSQFVTTESISVTPKNLKSTAVETGSVSLRDVVKSISLSTRIPQKLKHIELSINNAQSILNLAENWDDEGALKVSKNVHSSAILFLKKYALFLLNDLKTVISAPDINPVKDGSIDLEWHTPNARMLINVNNSGKIGYYGDNFNDLNSIKGKVAADSVQTFLAVWMTKLTI